MAVARDMDDTDIGRQFRGFLGATEPGSIPDEDVHGIRRASPDLIQKAEARLTAHSIDVQEIGNASAGC